MAQFFQVVDSHTNVEELQTFSNTIVDQQGVRYIIQTSEPNQAFVLDNLIEQPVIQQFPQQQQVFLVSSPQKQTPTMQPVVLNHTLQQPVLLNSTPPLRALNRANMMRPRAAVGVIAPPVRPNNVRPRQAVRPAGQSTRGIIYKPMNTPRLNLVQPQVQTPVQPDSCTLNGNEMVKTEDGRILSLDEYNKFIEQKKLQQQQQVVRNLNPGRGGMGRGMRGGPPRPNVRAPINNRVATPRGATRMPSPTVIEPPKKNTGRIIHPNGAKPPKVLREFVASPEIKEIINQNGNSDEYENSIRMFVLLAGGEQRLITFTTPKEDCTIHEILEQVGVSSDADTKIALKDFNQDGINLVVSVGFEDEDDDGAEVAVPPPKARAPRTKKVVQPSIPAKVSTPPPEPQEEPKRIPGKMALCPHCGYLSEYFNKCQRCLRKLPENTKTVLMKEVRKPGIEINLKPRPAGTPNTSGNGNASSPTGSASKPAPPRRKPPKTRLQDIEHMVVTLSSDEEDDDSPNEKPSAETTTEDKEPTLEELRAASPRTSKMGSSLACCGITCRTIRIGSYRFVPEHDVQLNSKEMIIKIPHCQLKNEIVTIIITRAMIYKILANFQKNLPVVFIYLLPAEAEKIIGAIGMTADGDNYYNPVSENQLHRRFVLLPSHFGEQDKWVFQSIYNDLSIFEEISVAQANSILLKTCAQDVAQAIMNSGQTLSSEVRQLLIYPPGKGGITINTEDYMCLERDQFLNDVIIDFYLRHMVDKMAEEQRAKVQVFSTFFYTRLTTKPVGNLRKGHPSEVDSNLTAAQKRHSRVKNWTKNIDLFEKDFIIVPINENAHWFLAIICFPGLKDIQTFDGVVIKRELVKQTPKKKTNNIGPIKPAIQIKSIKASISEIEDNSDKDEAEGDDSEFELEDSDETAPTPTVDAGDSIPIKQPCILIFDSLAGAGRSRVVATLRDYLTCEYAAKKKQSYVFTKNNISGSCPKIPQQNNYTDCGLYLLQYVEHFFKDPIKDFHIPIKGLKEWFEEIVVTRKREDISNLIKDLMLTYNKDINILPAIALPTHNGEMIPENSSDKEDEENDETKESEKVDRDSVRGNTQEMDTESQSSQVSNSGSRSPESDSSLPAGDKSSNRQSAMSYLKAKRIVKVKADTTSDAGDEPKKRKLETATPDN